MQKCGTDRIMLSKPSQTQKGKYYIIFFQVHEIVKRNIWEEQGDPWENCMK